MQPDQSDGMPLERFVKVLANFMSKVYGTEALAEARRRVQRSQGSEDREIAQIWSAVTNQLNRNGGRDS